MKRLKISLTLYSSPIFNFLKKGSNLNIILFSLFFHFNLQSKHALIKIYVVKTGLALPLIYHPSTYCFLYVVIHQKSVTNLVARARKRLLNKRQKKKERKQIKTRNRKHNNSPKRIFYMIYCTRKKNITNTKVVR